MGELQWERIRHNIVSQGGSQWFELARAKLPGGWLVISRKETEYGERRFSAWGGLTFVPDPQHEWDGSSLP